MDLDDDYKLELMEKAGSVTIFQLGELFEESPRTVAHWVTDKLKEGSVSRFRQGGTGTYFYQYPILVKRENELVSLIREEPGINATGIQKALKLSQTKFQKLEAEELEKTIIRKKDGMSWRYYIRPADDRRSFSEWCRVNVVLGASAKSLVEEMVRVYPEEKELIVPEGLWAPKGVYIHKVDVIDQGEIHRQRIGARDLWLKLCVVGSGYQTVVDKVRSQYPLNDLTLELGVYQWVKDGIITDEGSPICSPMNSVEKQIKKLKMMKVQDLRKELMKFLPYVLWTQDDIDLQLSKES